MAVPITPAYEGRPMKQVMVRVYGPLNDFLPPGRQWSAFAHAFEGHESVKDVLEGLGIPHPEMDLILVNGEPVAFDDVVQNGNRIAVFPRFESVNIDEVTLVRPPLEALRFVLDGHLGKLARCERRRHRGTHRARWTHRLDTRSQPAQTTSHLSWTLDAGHGAAPAARRGPVPL